MKAIRIFLLVLIIIGLGLIVTQSFWVPSLVNVILQQQPNNTPVQAVTNTPAVKTKPSPTVPDMASVTIDQNTLNSTSLTPTITGHASGVSDINVKVVDYEGARMAQNDATFNSGTGLWSFPIDSSTETENTSGELSLNSPGKYSVYVIGVDKARNIVKVATGTLILTR
jgi:hypothetical protein